MAGSDLVDVIVRGTVSGTRNGVEWPPLGTKWVLPRAEAEDYARAGHVEIIEKPQVAKPAQYEPDAGVERAVASDDVTVEKRGPHAKPGPLTTKNAP